MSKKNKINRDTQHGKTATIEQTHNIQSKGKTNNISKENKIVSRTDFNINSGNYMHAIIVASLYNIDVRSVLENVKLFIFCLKFEINKVLNAITLYQ